MALIDDRIATKVARLSRECATIYEQVRVKNQSGFFQKLDTIESVLADRLNRRPISPLEIDAAVIDHRTQFERLCRTFR